MIDATLAPGEWDRLIGSVPPRRGTDGAVIPWRRSRVLLAAAVQTDPWSLRLARPGRKRLTARNSGTLGTLAEQVRGPVTLRVWDGQRVLGFLHLRRARVIGSRKAVPVCFLR